MQGKISENEAIEIIKKEVYLYQGQSDSLRFFTGSPEAEQNAKEKVWDFSDKIRDLSYLEEQIQRYDEELRPTISSTVFDNLNEDHVPPQKRIRWKGEKSDFARVYDILCPLIECSKTDWEKHFINYDGTDMTKATDLHKAKTLSKESQVNLLRTEVSKMKPEA